jgi:hypothetical protein
VHGLLVDVGFERVVGVWQLRQFVSHYSSPLLALGYLFTLPGKPLSLTWRRVTAHRTWW